MIGWWSEIVFNNIKPTRSRMRLDFRQNISSTHCWILNLANPFFSDKGKLYTKQEGCHGVGEREKMRRVKRLTKKCWPISHLSNQTGWRPHPLAGQCSGCLLLFNCGIQLTLANGVLSCWFCKSSLSFARVLSFLKVLTFFVPKRLPASNRIALLRTLSNSLTRVPQSR